MSACPSFCEFLSRQSASLEILAGPARGSRVPIDQARLRIGRGPGVDLAFDDRGMAREHAVIEFDQGVFHVYGKDPRRPVRLNGAAARGGRELKHADRLDVGSHTFEFSLEDRDPL